MVIKKKSFDIILIFVISLLITLIPWEDIRNYLFVDKQGYIYYLKYFTNRTLYLEINSPVDYLTNESLWHFFIFFLKESLYLSPETIFAIISFACVFSASLVLYRYSGKLYSILYLLNPVFIDFYSSQFRLAFAFTLWCFAYLIYKNHKMIAYLLIGISIFIHTSSALFISIGILSIYLSTGKFQYQNIKLIISFLIGLLVSLLTGPYLYEILSAVGDRRAEYKEMSYNIIFHSFWMFLLIVIAINAFGQRLRLKDVHYYSLSFLSLLLLNYFIGGYSSRYLAATFPFIIALIFYQRSIDKIIITTIYILYTLTYFASWLSVAAP